MKLEDQVCSFELAKRLRKLGVKQESLFWWVPWLREEYPKNHPVKAVETENFHVGEYNPADFKKKYAAFTIAELGEMLPITVHTTRFEMGYPWQSHYKVLDLTESLSPKLEYKHHEAANSEADARAKMLIYLIENGLVPTAVLEEVLLGG